MKNNKILLAILIFISLVAGCAKDPLDITPDGRITLDSVFNDPIKTEAYLNSVYSLIRKYGTSYQYWAMLSGFTDDAQDVDYSVGVAGAIFQYIDGQTTKDNDVFSRYSATGSELSRDVMIYNRDWEGIRKANIFLERANNEKSIPDPNIRGRMIAEAKVLRAHYYLDVMRLFGNMPVMDTSLPVDFDWTTIKRNTFQECTDFIVKNCNEAIAEPNLPWRITTTGDKGRMTKAIAHAIKSQVLLFNASPLWNPSNDKTKWQAAAAASKEALDALTTNNYALYPNYARYFFTNPDISANPADKEVIFTAIDYNSFNSGYAFFSSIIYLEHGINKRNNDKSGNNPTQELIDSYDMINGQEPILGYNDEKHLSPIINTASGYDDQKPYLNRDPRFYASIWYNGARYGVFSGTPLFIQAYNGGDDAPNIGRKSTASGYYMRKYTDTTATSNGSARFDFRLMRLAELYLNYAEAENEANGPANAYAPINAIRARVGMPPLPTGLSQEAMRNRIRKERRVELAFEENRFYDVRRWKVLPQTNRWLTGMSWVKNEDGTFTGKRVSLPSVNNEGRRVANDRFNLLPIPTSEIWKMPLFEQNPGY